MRKVDKLRVQLTEDQRTILNEIWRYYRKNNYGMPAITLHDKFGSEEAVRSAIEPLGGDVIFIPSQTGEKRRYQLDFIGYLLAEQGEELEDLLARYLEYVQKQLKDDAEFYEIDLEEAMEGAKFTPEQKTFFKEMFYRTPFHGLQGTRICLPPDMEGWYYAQDMREYIQERVMKKYDPSTPIDGGRPIYIQVRPPFIFERDTSNSVHINGPVGVVQTGAQSNAQVKQTFGTKTSDVLELIREFRQSLQSLPPDQQQEAAEVVDALEEEIQSDTPRKGRIKAFLFQLASFTSNTASNVIATAISRALGIEP
jgi:hypothetical protein